MWASSSFILMIDRRGLFDDVDVVAMVASQSTQSLHYSITCFVKYIYIYKTAGSRISFWFSGRRVVAIPW